MTEMDYQVVLALLQQSQEDVLGLRKQLAAHDSSALQGSMDRMQASMDDMLKTLRATQTSLKQTQVALNEATDQNRKHPLKWLSIWNPIWTSADGVKHLNPKIFR